MKALFFNAISISIQASCFIAAVMVLRIILKKAPKFIICALWALAALRLIIPFSFESSLSLVPKELSSEYIYSEYFENESYMDTDFSGIGLSAPITSEIIFEDDYGPEKSNYDISSILSAVWTAGVVIMISYAFTSSVLIKRKIRFSVKKEKGIKQSEEIDSPFVFGIITPVIYIPYGLSEDDASHVIAHERAHIKRGDHLWKPFGFLLLSVYWFNPLMWISYILLCRDIEAACDEKVIKNMSGDNLKSYSTALLNCSIHRRIVSACPVAFGETDIKSRIKNVMSYKKPGFWIMLLAFILCIVISVCFLSNPKTNDFPENTEETTESNEAQSETYVPGLIPFYYAENINMNDIVKEYAENLVLHHAEKGGSNVVGARIRNIEKISTGTSGLTENVFLFRLTYELSAEKADGTVLAGSTVTDDGWYKFDNTYFVMVCVTEDSKQRWFKAGALTEETIEKEYTTSAMIHKYGNKYTAAAMETAEEVLKSIGGESYEKYTNPIYYDGLFRSAWDFAEEKAEKAGIVLDKESAVISEDKENNTVSIYFYEKDGGLGVIRVKYKRNSDTSFSSTDEFVMLLDNETLEEEKTAAAIEFLLDRMISSAGSEDADANTVIGNNKSEYDTIVSFWYGKSLRYIFSEFLKGGQTGLRGEIMKKAMLDILDEDEIIKYASKNGQDYFDVWLKQAKSVASQHDKKWLEENTPNIALALEMAENNV